MPEGGPDEEGRANFGRTWSPRSNGATGSETTVTYCLALRLHEGLVFLADTRTNAGVDNISSYRKLHVIQPAPDRIFVIESAGSLATTQEVLDRIQRDLKSADAAESLATVDHLFEAALYVGRLSREVSLRHRDALSDVGADGTATFILGGQIGSEPADILLVYPEGNYIRASDERPFLQIGESKYGKFMLELAVETKVDLETATMIAIGSMMSTAAANLSVGPPYDVGVYLNDSLTVEEFRLDSDSPVLRQLRETWERHLLQGVADLQSISHEEFAVELPNALDGRPNRA
jgi:putative proteasome-type protease